ncbi:MAG: biotin carboxylase [Hydrogenophaga sp.]|nr:carboxyl transferase domain-containing protein [Hydrogenophaga sp.]NIM42042.1 biotin carboxylase [Hydrogenophaga sp.]NIN27341.1 biotin carboxylase [Hydrogenophaga sp.]NIN32042.1 biotin carboxylase [Hydrogenophaga sp.]NIN56197.1 biotin carboxylase [Hydrogenophaga sp.]NIO52419.1 biotin carboxylase [Hydrogenophaga sp.]
MRSPLQAQVVQWLAQPGDAVRQDQPLLVVEAMKMEHELRAERDGRLAECLVVPGDTVNPGDPLWRIDAAAIQAPRRDSPTSAPEAATPERDELRRLRERLAFTDDAARPEAVARRHALGLRTARENLADLCDAGSFIEYGALAVAAQATRRSEAELIAQTPADGMVTGIGSVNGAMFGPERARTAVLAYDATVLAGTQGIRNHQKTDRLLGIALDQRLPVVLFAEGGGGRPGDTDMPIVAGLHVGTFAAMARLSGRVPTIGIAAGRCFAGNAALLGCCDVIIATRGSNIGMGGPAMVEGGGLGRFPPEAIGPAGVQHASGVIDLLVDDEAQAVAAARRCLAFFQGRVVPVPPPPLERLREALPASRSRSYDSRGVLEGLADDGSVVWLREGFGAGIHTALARFDGRAVGVLVNNPQHLGGAIDPDAADKAARFMRWCDAHGLPLLSLVDTPGFMVGPEVEARAQVRHVSRLFVVAAALRVPFFSVVLRKGFGLGAMGMTAGGFHAPGFTVAWPGAEFGAMGLEGAVRLGYRKELEALPEGPQRQALFDDLLARQIAQGAAIPMATTLEIDAVIDPADTRAWLLRGLEGAKLRDGPAVRTVDPW